MTVEIWGILNVTPDSFSDGGEFLEADSAASHAVQLVQSGADVIDIGGESTRPRGDEYGGGFARLSTDAELQRIVPVLERLQDLNLGDAKLAIDTANPKVAERAFALGCSILNTTHPLPEHRDASNAIGHELVGAAVLAGAAIVSMHNRAEGELSHQNTAYLDVASEVRDSLVRSANYAISCGLPKSSVYVDPGFGFAKTPEQSLELLRKINMFVDTGLKVLVGVSRKTMLGKACPKPGGETPFPTERDPASVVAAVHAARCGAYAVRVHNVEATRQGLQLAESLGSSDLSSPKTTTREA